MARFIAIVIVLVAAALLIDKAMEKPAKKPADEQQAVETPTNTETPTDDEPPTIQTEETVAEDEEAATSEVVVEPANAKP